MSRLHVSDHALVRFLERGAGLDVEGLRSSLQAALQRACEAAEAVGGLTFKVEVGDLVFVVVDGVVVTITGARKR